MGSSDFSNWIIYVTVKQTIVLPTVLADFSNWIIYVTVKQCLMLLAEASNFSNWIIYVTVKLRGLWKMTVNNLRDCKTYAPALGCLGVF